MVLESDTSRLLMKEYETNTDGSVVIKPCTVIYLPNGDADPEDPRKRVIILRAPQARHCNSTGRSI